MTDIAVTGALSTCQLSGKRLNFGSTDEGREKEGRKEWINTSFGTYLKHRSRPGKGVY